MLKTDRRKDKDTVLEGPVGSLIISGERVRFLWCKVYHGKCEIWFKSQRSELDSYNLESVRQKKPKRVGDEEVQKGMVSTSETPRLKSSDVSTSETPILKSSDVSKSEHLY
ncbi:hypothetical protein J6590_011319 [Homalodisca vitripennis]|nr:hypothetical protein J6590_011319 [Homalodisca vitripennis]